VLPQNWRYTTLAGVEDALRPPLKGERRCDVLVVGGCAAGLAATSRFVGTGKKVILLEEDI
jgi:NADPH-dependent 2,4-dienoyl-CoA reductase/sulfur reductase-like enzyme